MQFARILALALAAALAFAPVSTLALTAVLPDGRTVAPAGFTIPVENFTSALALSPDGRWLAALSPDRGAIDVIDSIDSVLVQRLAIPSATGMTWTSDGLYVSRGYTGIVARYAYDGTAKTLDLTKRPDLSLGVGLLNGIAEDPGTHRIAVARTANERIALLDDAGGGVVGDLKTTGQPYGVAFVGGAIVATLYNSDHLDAWRSASGDPTRIPTGPHPTAILADGTRAFVANADGHDVVLVDSATLSVVRRFDLAVSANPPPGQTPSGMALSPDHRTLYVAESGYNDVAVVDVTSGRVSGRIPTGWYPMSLAFADRPTDDEKDLRLKPQLWIVSAKGLGAQPDPGGEWNGTYTGLLQHLVADPRYFAAWSAAVARNDRFSSAAPPRDALAPIKHVVFIVRENKHFDEEFADERGASGDPTLLLYGRKFTPNAHALAERFTLFDNFMSNGEASDWGHAWTTQGFANDYHERNAHSRDESTAGVTVRVPWSIWPDPEAGDDTLPPQDMNFDWFTNLSALPKGPRINCSGVFGPRGQLVDELERSRISFRVYGEQLTMSPDGSIAPGLVAHAAKVYPGAHIDFTILDTTRAKMFLDDVARHGLAQYSYLTLPTDHTAGLKAGFYTPAAYVASNDVALGRIVAGLSKRPEWRDTLVFVTEDDAQGTGDHVNSHRMPAFAIGPYVRRAFVDHTHYSIPSLLRTVEVLFGLGPLNVYDAASTPFTNAFARQPETAPYVALASTVPMDKNPGKPKAVSFSLDGPDSQFIPAQEWRSIKGATSLAQHVDYLRSLGMESTLAEE